MTDNPYQSIRDEGRGGKGSEGEILEIRGKRSEWGGWESLKRRGKGPSPLKKRKEERERGKRREEERREKKGEERRGEDVV